jgi:hypothetical protein
LELNARRFRLCFAGPTKETVPIEVVEESWTKLCQRPLLSDNGLDRIGVLWGNPAKHGVELGNEKGSLGKR